MAKLKGQPRLELGFQTKVGHLRINDQEADGSGLELQDHNPGE